VGRDDAHPFAQAMYRMLFGDRDPVVDPGTASGTPGNWWTVFALVPDAFDHTTAGFQFYRSPNRRGLPVVAPIVRCLNCADHRHFGQPCSRNRQE
jgi:hypothetical protein